MATAIRTAASGHMARNTALVSLAVAAAVMLGGGLAWACSVNANIPDGGLTPNHGPPGTDVQVEGREFNPGRVEIRWDSTTGPLLGTAMVEPQDEGSFETTVTIPEQASQQVHTIVAVQQPYKAQATFEVTSPQRAPDQGDNPPRDGDGNQGKNGDGNNELSGDADGEQSDSQADGDRNSQSATGGEAENALSGGHADTNGDGSGDEGADSRSAGEPRNALNQGHQAGPSAGSSPGSPREEVSAEDTKPPRESQETPTVNGQPEAPLESIAPTSDADDAASPRGESPGGTPMNGTQAVDGQPSAGNPSDQSEAADPAPQGPSTESESPQGDEAGLDAGGQEEREPSPSSRAAGRDLWSGFAGDESPSLTPAGGDAAAPDGMSEELLLALAMVSVGTLGLFGAGAFALRRRSAQLRHSYPATRTTR